MVFCAPLPAPVAAPPIRVPHVPQKENPGGTLRPQLGQSTASLTGAGALMIPACAALIPVATRGGDQGGGGASCDVVSGAAREVDDGATGGGVTVPPNPAGE
jgi:hypothetical protein